MHLTFSCKEALPLLGSSHTANGFTERNVSTEAQRLLEGIALLTLLDRREHLKSHEHQSRLLFRRLDNGKV